MKSFFVKKAEGSINHFLSLMALLLIAVIFLFGMYYRNIGKLSILASDSVDASNLASAVVDTNVYGQTNNYFRIIGSAQLNNSVSQSEADDFNKRLNIYINTLQQNLGLDNGLGFCSGGPAGFAVDQFIGGYNGGNDASDKKVVIDQFSIYDIVLEKNGDSIVTDYAIVEYTATNISSAGVNLLPTQIQKTIYRNGAGSSLSLNRNTETLASSTVMSPDGTLIINPSVYSKISFRLRAPSVYESRFFNPSGNNTIERIVHKEGTVDIARGNL